MNVILNGEPFEEVDCFKYLGSQVAADSRVVINPRSFYFAQPTRFFKNQFKKNAFFYKKRAKMNFFNLCFLTFL